MSVLRVYLETTIPSFFHTLRTDADSVARMQWTRQWWNEVAPTCELFSSPAVLLELQRGSKEKTAERLDLISRLDLLEINETIEEITKTYIERLVMPNDPTGDALHLAIASYHGMDVLLTWNCRHLANPNKNGHILRVNRELGLSTPVLTTPYNYIGGEA
jgi:predicted nucleic acid-binding protein